MEVKFLRRCLLGFALLTVYAIGSVGIATASEGFRLSQTCAGCHGTAGASPGTTIPIIGGQDALSWCGNLNIGNLEEILQTEIISITRVEEEESTEI